MDERSDRGTDGPRVRRRRTARVLVVAGLALWLVGLMTAPARASRIHGHHLIVVNNTRSLGTAWARFLSGKHALWEIASPPRFPSGIVLASSLGRLVDTPFVDYLSWRRNLDPARFDHYHPIVGPELARFTPSARTVPAAVTTGGGPVRHFQPAPQNLPEPGSLGIAVVLLGAGLAMRNRNRGRAA